MADKMAKRVGESQREIMEAKRRKIMQVLRGEGDGTVKEGEEEKKLEEEERKKEVMKELDIVQALLSSTLLSKDQQIQHLEKQLKSANGGSDSKVLTKRLAGKNKEIEVLTIENLKFCSALEGAKDIWTKFESEMKAKDGELKEAKQELDGAKRVVKKLTTELEKKSTQLERSCEKYKFDAKEKESELRAREGELEEMRVEKEKALEERRKGGLASELLLEAARLRISELSKLQGSDLTHLFSMNFRLEKENKELKRLVETKDSGIVQCKADFVLLQEKIFSLLSVREALQRAVGEKELLVAEKEQMVGEVSRENVDLKSRLADLSDAVDQCKSEIVMLVSLSDEKVETLEKENNRLQAEVASSEVEMNVNIEDRKHSSIKISRQQQQINDKQRINNVLTVQLDDKQLKLEQNAKELKELHEKLAMLESSQRSRLAIVEKKCEAEKLFKTQLKDGRTQRRNSYLEEESDQTPENQKRDDEVASTSTVRNARDSTMIFEPAVEDDSDDVHVVFDDLLQAEVQDIIEDLLNNVVTVSSINALRAGLCESKRRDELKENDAQETDAKTSQKSGASATAQDILMTMRIDNFIKMRNILLPQGQKTL